MKKPETTGVINGHWEEFREQCLPEELSPTSKTMMRGAFYAGAAAANSASLGIAKMIRTEIGDISGILQAEHKRNLQ